MMILVKLKCTWNADQLEQHIAILYPALPLQLVGISYPKSSKAKKTLSSIGEGLSVFQIQNSIGKGKLIIIPKGTSLCLEGPIRGQQMHLLQQQLDR